MMRINLSQKPYLNKRGFSLIELIVVVAILGVMVVVIAPSLLTYNERSRAEKDTSSMDELVNAVQLALADSEIYDEVVRFSTVDNVSCYVDTNSEANYKKIVTKKNPDGVDQYTFTSDARTLDETPYFAAGNMRGVTLTFAPDKGSNGSTFELKQGVVNQYIQVANNQRIGAMPKLYNRIRSSVGDIIQSDSQTYRNSEYTIFIRLGSTGGNDAGQQDSITAYGQWSGTNLPAQVQYQIVADRTVGDTGNQIVEINDNKWNETNGNKLTLKPGDLNGGGSFTPTTSTGNSNLVDSEETEGNEGETIDFNYKNIRYSLVNHSGLTIMMSEDNVLKIYEAGDIEGLALNTTILSANSFVLKNTGTEFDNITMTVSTNGKEISGKINGSSQVVARATEFAYKNVRYTVIDSGGITVFMDDNNVVYMCPVGSDVGMPLETEVISSDGFVVRGTGTMLDGIALMIGEGGKYVYCTIDNYTTVVGIQKGLCTHTSISNAAYNIEHRACWLEFVDGNGNVKGVSSITSLNDFKVHKLRCTWCYGEIPMKVFDDSDYLYMYNAFIEPQKNNGTWLETRCVDTEGVNFGGWVAIPYDIANIDNLYTSINGQPVVGTYVAPGATIPQELSWYNVYFLNSAIDSQVTFIGESETFLKKWDSWSIENRKTMEAALIQKTNYYRQITVTVVCDDVTLVFKNGEMTKVENNVAACSFTVDGKTYYFEEGMCWHTFVESDYNVDGFMFDPGSLLDKNGVGIGTKGGKIEKPILLGPHVSGEENCGTKPKNGATYVRLS